MTFRIRAIFSAAPLETNILEWHYVIQGTKDTPFYGGYYHGRCKLTQSYTINNIMP